MHRAIPIHVGGDEIITRIFRSSKMQLQDHPLLVCQVPVLVEDEVPQPIKHINPIHLLDRLDDVGVVAHHHIRPGLHRHLGEVQLVAVGF